MTATFKEYRTWGEYLKAARALPPESCAGGSGSWAGGAANMREALEIAAKGWREGMALVKSISLPAVRAVVHSHGESADWTLDVAGAGYDVGEYLAGSPECWLTRETDAPRPCIRLVANLVSSAGVYTEAIQHRGAGIVALAMALQTAGYVVEVWSIGGTNVYACKADSWVRVRLTDPNGGPIDPDRLLFALAHPAASRMLAYNLMTANVGGDTSQGHSLGWPEPGGYDKPNALPEKIESWRGDLYLGPPRYADADWKNPAAVSDWVKRQYETLTAGGHKKA